MKFDCGESWQEKKARLSEWHSFFAIFPKKVGPHDCRFMEAIERKGEYLSDTLYLGSVWLWQYRAIK